MALFLRTATSSWGKLLLLLSTLLRMLHMLRALRVLVSIVTLGGVVAVRVLLLLLPVTRH